MVRYRAKLRTHELTIQSDTRAAYNIINGGPRNMAPAPSLVPLPSFLDHSDAYALTEKEEMVRGR